MAEQLVDGVGERVSKERFDRRTLGKMGWNAVVNTRPFVQYAVGG